MGSNRAVCRLWFYEPFTLAEAPLQNMEYAISAINIHKRRGLPLRELLPCSAKVCQGHSSSLPVAAVKPLVQAVDGVCRQFFTIKLAM